VFTGEGRVIVRLPGLGQHLARGLPLVVNVRFSRRENVMIRVLMIDRDRPLIQSVALACLESGVALRAAETLSEGVRCLADEPVSAVLVDSTLMRLSRTDLARLFETVAPGVPVVVLVDRAFPLEEVVKLQLQGFDVLVKPFEVCEVLAKLDVSR